MNGYDNIIEQLERAKHNFKITNLHLDPALDFNPISDDKATVLMQALKDTHITTLVLGVSCLDKNGVTVIAQILRNSKITRLDFGYSQIDNDGIKELTTVLRDTHITTLIFNEGRIWAQALKATNITKLHLHMSNSIISNDRVKEVEKVLKGTNITKLHLSMIDMVSYDKVKEVTKDLKDTHITTLIIYADNIMILDDEITALTQALKDSKVTKLALVGCVKDDIDIEQYERFAQENGIPWDCYTSFSNHKVKKLAEGLEYTNITELNLSNNYICKNGVTALAQVLRSTKITKLNLSDNYISDDGITALAQVLRSTEIIELDLYNNRISDEVLNNLNEIVLNNKKTADKLCTIFKILVFQENINFEELNKQAEDFMDMITNKPKAIIHLINNKNISILKLSWDLNKFCELISRVCNNSDYNYVDILSKYEGSNFPEVVKALLVNRPNDMYADLDRNILHPYVVELLSKYDMPVLYKVGMSNPTPQEMIKYYHEHSDLRGALKAIHVVCKEMMMHYLLDPDSSDALDAVSVVFEEMIKYDHDRAKDMAAEDAVNGLCNMVKYYEQNSNSPNAQLLVEYECLGKYTHLLYI